jgi:hypothetical protein
MLKELDEVKHAGSSGQEKPKGMLHLEDDAIAGNPDYMLYLSKDLASTRMDPSRAQNPFVVAKLGINAIEAYDFSQY